MAPLQKKSVPAPSQWGKKVQPSAAPPCSGSAHNPAESKKLVQAGTGLWRGTLKTHILQKDRLLLSFLIVFR